MRTALAILPLTVLLTSSTRAQFSAGSTSTNTIVTNVPTAFAPQINVPQVATPTVTVPQAATVHIPQAAVPASTAALPPTTDGAPRTTPGTPRIVVPPQASVPTADNLLSRQLTIRRPSPAPPPPLDNTASLAQEQPTIITNADSSVTMPLAQGLTNAPQFSPRIWDNTNAPAPAPLQPYHW